MLGDKVSLLEEIRGLKGENSRLKEGSLAGGNDKIGRLEEEVSRLKGELVKEQGVVERLKGELELEKERREVERLRAKAELVKEREEVEKLRAKVEFGRIGLEESQGKVLRLNEE